MSAAAPEITGSVRTVGAKDKTWSLPTVRVMRPDEPRGRFIMSCHVKIDGPGPKGGIWKVEMTHDGDCKRYAWRQILDPESPWCGAVENYCTGEPCECKNLSATMKFVGELPVINNSIPDGELHATVFYADAELDVVLIDSK
jgi:hypothetical protein